MKRVGIIGASGFAGAELLRLIAQHPQCELVFATGDSLANTPICDTYPNLGVWYNDRKFVEYSLDLIEDLDCVFVALPHGLSQDLVAQLMGLVPLVIDVAADFRLKDLSVYSQWYGGEHKQPALVQQSVYGLPELHRQKLKTAKLIAVPGCYPTAATIALAPLVKHGVIEPHSIIINALSGVSGAGRALKHTSMYATVAETCEAYALSGHRHCPEIEQNIEASVLFTPHIVPMTRGILATCYAKPIGKTSTAQLLALMRGVYASEPFVRILNESPTTKATSGTNFCYLTLRLDERTNTVVVISAIDNLVKGTAGGAIQSMNIAMGIEETTGLTSVAIYP